MSGTGSTYRHLAEATWRWVLDQVRTDEAGPWIPESVSAGHAPEMPVPGYRDGMHSGLGGLAHALAEVRLARPWTAEERELANAAADRVRAGIPDLTDCTYFDGLGSAAGVLTGLGAPGAEAVVERLASLATRDGWPQSVVGPPRYRPEARLNDVTLGTASVLLAALWLRRHRVAGAGPLAERAAAVLLAETEPLPTGTTWSFVPPRFAVEPLPAMPNLSHGVAGVATALALAGAELARGDLTAAARSGAEHLVTLGDDSGDGFVVPRYVPMDGYDEDELTFGWCHGAAGTSLLFVALDRTGVGDVAGRDPRSWQRRCLHSVRTSGLPARLRPGFWDNDGRCCGTAGVGDLLLDSWQRTGEDEDLAFALHLADVLVDRAVVEGPHASWQFVEHHRDEPLLPPGVGWMQGAAGIAAFLFRAGRVVQDGRPAGAVRRMDNWWALPDTVVQAGPGPGWQVGHQ